MALSVAVAPLAVSRAQHWQQLCTDSLNNQVKEPRFTADCRPWHSLPDLAAVPGPRPPKCAGAARSRRRRRRLLYATAMLSACGPAEDGGGAAGVGIRGVTLLTALAMRNTAALPGAVLHAMTQPWRLLLVQLPTDRLAGIVTGRSTPLIALRHLALHWR